ncbi:MAG: OmpH family outer membrane protein [Candidatus Aminicenantes bacterium]|nr:OmpH family outer membrane protein [Candidatus Aminicenantes bacterium]
MMKKTLFVALAAFLTAALANTALAQQGLKMGVINSQEVLEKSVEGKRVIGRLQERERKSTSDVAKLDEDIRQLETRLSTQRLTLSEEAALQLNSDLDRKRKERARTAEDAVRDIQELQFRLYSKLQSELLPIIEQLGKERGLDIILDLTKSGAVYFSPQIDVTAEVIRRYDASKAAPAAK